MRFHLKPVVAGRISKTEQNQSQILDTDLILLLSKFLPPVTSLGLVSPGVETDGVTPIFPEKY